MTRPWGTMRVPGVLLASMLCIAALCSALTPSAASADTSATSQASQLAEQEAISLELAKRDLSLQAKAGGIVEQLEGALGGAYAGVSFDLKEGRFHIGVTDSTSLAAAETVAANDNIAEATTYDHDTYTWHELQEAEATWNAKLATLESKQQAFVGADARTNSVDVLLPSNLSSSEVSNIEAQANTSSVAATVAPVAARRLEITAGEGGGICQFPYCPQPHRGGTRIESEPDEEGYYHWCTMGFVVLIPAKSNAIGILTAGHCMEPKGFPWTSGTWKTSECDYGKAIRHTLEEGENKGDAGLLWDKSGCIIEPYISAWGKNEDLPIVGTRESYEGMYLCHEGANLGSQCGAATYHDVTTTINYEDVGRGKLKISHTDQMCAHGGKGDSGGPWAVWEAEPPTEAWGTDIHLGANELTCPEGGISIGFELPHALSLMEVKLDIY
ncbi:MAG TPA: hypothetical protein VN892_10140 [Solirubrobacteraceae bacterium]|nr:hypothetical protein [Solirubrobacteraceae bacterium]